MDLLCQVVFKKRAILYVYCEFLFLLVYCEYDEFLLLLKLCKRHTSNMYHVFLCTLDADGIHTSVAGSVYFLRSDHRLLLLLLLLLLL